MLVKDAVNLKVGDVILVAVRVTETSRPGTVAHDRGWIHCEPITDTVLLGSPDLILSCSDAVTSADLAAWKKGK